MPKAKGDADAQEGVKKIRFTLDDGKPLDLDLTDLTTGERIEIEDHMGVPYPLAMGGRFFLSEKLQAFLAFVALRRRKKAAALDDVMASKKLDIVYDPAEEASDPPTKAGRGKRTPASSGTKAS